eukprot:CAMPEP_0185589884 /NCGR_PEP_ID=MMETSP0434-20130131/58630_1 /TAXON_ID=626734 ORGANISM="Favella taraikaensis, Strain Fe Narragansett Bay" /NCGR_SAMPLE_ID=MMETSP0434 /ASSEMBLY_ACC=CAM_ASM_000379 /LENGTH=73 /DNA_ID=CAMNT_0028213623 /DNA_START=1195 /DNA_END=1416 /DNA_ORIENTATION=-
MPESDSKPLSDTENTQVQKSEMSDLTLKLIQKAYLRGAPIASSSESTMDSAGLRLSDYHTTGGGSEPEDSAQA